MALIRPLRSQNRDWRNVASRSGELVRRLAAVFALFKGELEISEQTMIAACEIVEHSLQEWARYLGQNAVAAQITSLLTG